DREPIVVYGTSIAQGGCAPRPGMAWTNILERNLHIPVINLGFSGNGPLEKEIVDLIVAKKAKAFVLDCLPNMVADSELNTSRIKYAVHTIRTKHPETPIIMVDHSGYLDGRMSTAVTDGIKKKNQTSSKSYEELRSQGVQKLFYLTHQDIGLGMEDSVDGIHPTDLGMWKYAKAYEKLIREIMD